MSVSSLVNRVSYTGNGTADTFSYTFRVFDEDHLRVIVRDTSNVETVLTKTTHYTVTGVGNLSGGSVALVNGVFDWLDAEGDLKTDYVLVIRRVLPLKQETEFRNQGSFFPEDHEDSFDKQVMINQAQQDEIDRTLKLPESVDPLDFNASLPATIVDPLNAGATIIVNATGDGLDVGPTVTSIAVHEADTTDVHGITDTSALLTETNSKTFTNKSINGDNNTLSNISISSIKTVLADANKAILRDASGVIQSSFISDININNSTISNSKLINVSTQTIKGRITAGSGSPEDLTATQATSILNSFVGDSGSGGTKGLVPAPASGDASANKFLKADGLWSTVVASPSFSYRSVTTTDTATTADYAIVLSGASFTQTLYTAVGNSGRIIEIVHGGTSLTQVYTLATTGGQTIGGVSSGSYALYTNGETLKLVSNGANWIILDHRTDCVIDSGTITIGSSGTSPTKSSTKVTDSHIIYSKVGH